jgi:excisionase family DNA binding protein
MQRPVTPQEAAEFLRLSEGAVLRQAREGTLPGAKIGRTWRFSRRLLLEWIEEASISEEMVEQGMVEVVKERMAAPGKRVPLAEVEGRSGIRPGG